MDGREGGAHFFSDVAGIRAWRFIEFRTKIVGAGVTTFSTHGGRGILRVPGEALRVCVCARARPCLVDPRFTVCFSILMRLSARSPGRIARSRVGIASKSRLPSPSPSPLPPW